MFALPEPHRRRATGGYGPADPRREAKRRRSSDLGTVLLLPEAVFQRQGSSTLKTRQPDALRPGGLRLPVEPRWPPGATRSDKPGISALRAHPAMAHLG